MYATKNTIKKEEAFPLQGNTTEHFSDPARKCLPVIDSRLTGTPHQIMTPLYMNSVIQKQGGSSDEEETEEEDAPVTYDMVLDAYRKIFGEDTDTFEQRVGDYRDTDFYHCIQYILEHDSDRLSENQHAIYKTIGLIDDCNIDSVTLCHYGCVLFDYPNNIIAKLSASSDSYLRYTDFFRQPWFNNEGIIKIFFAADKGNLDALELQTLAVLLNAPDAGIFIAHQADLSPWFQSYVIQHTIKIGADNCIFLCSRFSPDDYGRLPEYAERIDPAHLQPFFARCHELHLGINAIDEITRNSAYMALADNDPAILKIINKNNRFRDWIRALEGLLAAKTAVLEISGAKQLPSKSDLITYEKIITVTADQSVIDTFVYHYHPDGIKVSVEHAHVTNKHLKPDKSSQIKLDYGEIPEHISTALGI